MDSTTRLVLQITGAMAADTANITQRVHSGFVRDVYIERARVIIIRQRITDLLNGPYAPNPDYVRAALVVADSTCMDWLDEHFSGWQEDGYPRLSGLTYVEASLW